MSKNSSLLETINGHIARGSIPPYVYSYPTRSSYRNMQQTVTPCSIWEMDCNNSTSKQLNLYIHFPFCKAKCEFCNLYSIALVNDEVFDRYIEAICKQLTSFAPIIKKRDLRTIYFGGGTPTLFSAKQFNKIFKCLDTIYPNWRIVIEEVSIEATPVSVAKNPELINQLKILGLSRVNIGIQTLDSAELNDVKGINNSNISIIYKALDNLRELGISNISTDLLIGIDGQTDESYSRSVESLVELRPDTISTYFLTIRPDAKISRNSRYNFCRNSNLYLRYDAGREIILNNGYVHDTNIRFKLLGRGGYRQKWLQFNGVPYLGLGCGARTYTNTVDYSFGQIPSRESIIQFINDPYLIDTPIKEGFTYDDDERIRKRLILNLFDLNLDDIDPCRRYNYIYEELFDACMELELLTKVSENRFQLTFKGLKYRDIISWMLFSTRVVELDKEFYQKLYELNIGNMTTELKVTGL